MIILPLLIIIITKGAEGDGEGLEDTAERVCDEPPGASRAEGQTYVICMCVYMYVCMYVYIYIYIC